MIQSCIPAGDARALGELQVAAQLDHLPRLGRREDGQLLGDVVEHHRDLEPAPGHVLQDRHLLLVGDVAQGERDLLAFRLRL